MILGVDHIALSTSNLVKSGANLQRLGFNLKFVEEKLLNHPAKTNFLTHYGQEHGVAFYQSGGIAVELISHMPAIAATIRAGYRPLIELPDDVDFEGENTGEKVHSILGEYQVWRLKELDAFCLVQHNRKVLRPTVSGIELEVFDPTAAAQKWITALGFAVVSSSPDYFVLKKKSPILKWCVNLLLRRNDNIGEWQLDSSGWPCLALLSSNLKKDVEVAMKCGWTENSGIFTLTVNNAELSFTLLRGNDSEIIELIAMKGMERK